MEENGYVARIQRKKPKWRIIARRSAIANGRKSKIRSHIEYVFTEQKSRMGLVIHTIGIARATLKIAIANIIYNLKRLICLEKAATA